MSDYAKRLQQQIEQYRDVDVHDLPEIFHYWSNKYVRPIIESVFECSRFCDVYAAQFRRAFSLTNNRTVVSLGAGDASMEVDIAKSLRAAGERDFRIICTELSDHLIQRGTDHARVEGVSEHIVYEQADLNTWRPATLCAAFMANQSLHHFVELEGIFDLVDRHLAPGGRFISNDMIGRNGHLRWPEAKVITDYFWCQLPDEYKYHHQLKRFEIPDFIDWDCSSEGFEGVRAQDVLPLLINRFGFTHFAAWGGLTDTFLDRGFGHNYSAANQSHLDFIDTLEQLNSSMISIGFIKPTQMFAVMVRDKLSPIKLFNGMSPSKALRDPTTNYLYTAPSSAP
jgi:hypothetical protein